MEGIQYIVDDKGEKTAVVIDLKQWGNIWSEFSTVLADRFREKEEWLYQDGGEEKLDRVEDTALRDRALEWSANNPPQESDLEELERKIRQS